MKIQVATILCAALLAAGCVSQQTYNTEVAKANTLNTAHRTSNSTRSTSSSRGELAS
jgi:outer membrane murein-binding lipoprotein Lpp